MNLKYDIFIHTEENLKLVRTNPEWGHSSVYQLERRIREHLESTFKMTCFYCKHPINNGIVSAEIDHILYKDKYKYFTFRPENLVLSCKKCNTSKSVHDSWKKIH